MSLPLHVLGLFCPHLPDPKLHTSLAWVARRHLLCLSLQPHLWPAAAAASSPLLSGPIHTAQQCQETFLIPISSAWLAAEPDEKP